jgi:hypothetical protein
MIARLGAFVLVVTCSAACAINIRISDFDHTGRPLYLGRGKRIASADQRLICYARDRGCTHPGCLQPGYHSEVHHAKAWSKGGLTDADNLFFVCESHHAMVDAKRCRTDVLDNGRLGWSKGSDPPRLNQAHHPEELLDDEEGA